MVAKKSGVPHLRPCGGALSYEPRAQVAAVRRGAALRHDGVCRGRERPRAKREIMLELIMLGRPYLSHRAVLVIPETACSLPQEEIP